MKYTVLVAITYDDGEQEMQTFDYFCDAMRFLENRVEEDHVPKRVALLRKDL